MAEKVAEGPAAGQTEPATFAERLFDAQRAWNVLDGQLTDEICRVLRLNPRDPEDWTFGDHSVDHYDSSFEVYGCPAWLRLDEAQRAEAWALGFDRCWLNHIDGSETHYWKGGGESRKTPGLHASREGDAAQPPSDSSAALREARRLLGRWSEADHCHGHICDSDPDGPCEVRRLEDETRAFVGEQNGKD